MPNHPPDRMDDETKRELLVAAKLTPRYLFRAWTNVPPPSGGSIGLNTTEAITPRAFFPKNRGRGKRIYDLTRKELREMCLRHLKTEPFDTEFSSWASSLQVAISFAYRTPANRYYISIIDTTELKENPIYHVPLLVNILGAKRFPYSYPHEYLAHGVISGEAHKAIPMQHLMEIGIPNYVGMRTPMPLCTAKQWARQNEITLREYDDAQRVAKLYGTKFGTAVMIAILTLKQRDGMLWRNGTNDVEHRINEYLVDAGFDIPGDFCADATILTDKVYIKDYGCVEQMIRMLRAITNLNHGRGARDKRPSRRARDIILDEEREAERRRN